MCSVTYYYLSKINKMASVHNMTTASFESTFVSSVIYSKLTTAPQPTQSDCVM